ncbi:phosphoribosylanthranilate isomerase [Streptomyces sp. NPDC001139]
MIDQEEADLLVATEVDWLGFPFGLPVHREDLSEEEAAAIIRGLPLSCRGVLITYMDEASEIVELAGRLGVQTVQLHGDVRISELRILHDQYPDLLVVKSLVVRDENEDELVEQALQLAPWVDMFITDTFDPGTGACGATGLVHDWRVSRRLREVTERPLMLAGGLRPENVKEAVSCVRPFAVDVHTGVEGPDGRKDPGRVADFVSAARRALVGGHNHE